MSITRLAALTMVVSVFFACSEPSAAPPLDAPRMSLMAGGTHRYATPGGMSGDGQGTISQPWSLGWALSSANTILQPGDTVWLRQGTYGDSSFSASKNGVFGNPIVYKQYPNEHAQVDGQIVVTGAYLTFWGFEVKQSNPMNHAGWYTIWAKSTAVGARFINLVIHDANKSGMLVEFPNGTIEVNGCIMYNNGTNAIFDHGIYVQGSSGLKSIEKNIFFNNMAFGMHAYSKPPQAALADITFRGNIAFNNGAISPGGGYGNILMGSDVANSTNQWAVSNLMYFSGSQGVNLTLGLPAVQGTSVNAAWNTILGGNRAMLVYNWANASITDNQIAGRTTPVEPDVAVDLRDPTVAGYNWQANSYYYSTSRSAWLAYYQTDPDGEFLELEEFLDITGFNNAEVPDVVTTTPFGTRWGWYGTYDPNRRHVWVYDPSGTGTVNVTIPQPSSWLVTGQQYKIYNVQKNVFTDPVATGTYNGSYIPVPMTGVTPPTPLGRTTATPPTTGPYFHSFVIVRQ
jgi:hypothetical protein